jgi:hypothetical protein
MGIMDMFRRWGGAQPEGQDLGAPEVEAAPTVQSRRRASAGGRASLWTEEPETCERCGRRLLVGEMPAMMQREDELVMVCPNCAMALAVAGFRTPPPAAEPKRTAQADREAA